MADDAQRPIVIRRKKRKSGGAHGGAWKIAYADFVTAMMAFFLLMWLLGSTTRADLNGISEYFQTPLKVAMQGGIGTGDSSSIVKGGGTDLSRTDGQVRKGDLPPTKSLLVYLGLHDETLIDDPVLRKQLVDKGASIDVNGTPVSASAVTVDYPFQFIMLQPVVRCAHRSYGVRNGDVPSPNPRSGAHATDQ